MSFADKTASELKEAYAKNACTTREVLDDLKKAVAAKDGGVHAFISFETSQPRHRKAAPGAPLAGIPIALKDNICVEGEEITCASKILKGFIAPYNATVVEKLLDAGAIMLGRTNMDEFAFGSSCETSCYGPTKNPWDLERVPGGSSGGSAACVAAGMAVASLGSDTGGSIRQPAALCGVVGMKPTYGRVSRFGLIAFASSLDQIGPFTKDVRDNALVLGAIAGHDPKDSTSADVPVPDYASFLGKSIAKMKIGVLGSKYYEGTSPAVQSAVRVEAVKTLQKLGAEIVEIDLPNMHQSVSVYYLIAPSEASSNLARFDGVRFGHRASPAGTLLDMFEKSRGEGFGAEAKRRIILGTFALSSGYYDAYYLRAMKVRTKIKRDFDEAFKKVDVIMTPTSPSAAFKIGEKSTDPLEMYLSDIYTISANLAGIPAISLPGGFDESKGKPLPIGVQFLGKPFAEGTLYQVSHAFEQATDFHKRRPAC